jgi:sn-glycerol 3-phosphate transport system permease protein
MKKALYIASYIISWLFKILVLAVFVFPFLWMFSVALQTDYETIATDPMTIIPATPQFVNFAIAWSRGPFATYLKNSVLVIVFIIAIQILVMVPAAYAFAKYDFKGKGLMFSLVLIAFMTPTQITFLPLYQMMAKWRVGDFKILQTLIPQILPFMTNAFGIFLLRQYFMQVPNELIEAAKLDKAGEFKIIFKIMLPMSRAALSTVTLFSFVSHWNEYFWPLIMTNTDNVRPLTVGIVRLRDTEGLLQWNVIMAGNVILVLPILLVYIFASRNIIKAFAYSGIK